MASIAVLERKCDGCKACVNACPFGAIDWINGKPAFNAACRVCGICQKNCKNQALVRLESKTRSLDKSAWRGILVIAEARSGELHPVSLELVGKALSMNDEVSVALIGSGLDQSAGELAHYGVSKIYVYDDEKLSFFRAEAFADCAQDAIDIIKPSVVLVGATALGRSLAPRVATRLRTGLTADCTSLEMRPNSDLVQIRPAFGGNIMAQIVTPNTRPQFATVRYKVMNAPNRRQEAQSEIIRRALPRVNSPVKHISTSPVGKTANISDAEVLVVGGRGIKKESDLQLIKTLAAALAGEWATTRPLVEKGWNTNARQIGLSGRTVRPKLIITAGVSGAIQFAACMKNSQHIIAINTDENAPIFEVAHVALVGDLYEIIPGLIARLREMAKCGTPM